MGVTGQKGRGEDTKVQRVYCGGREGSLGLLGMYGGQWYYKVGREGIEVSSETLGVSWEIREEWGLLGRQGRQCGVTREIREL